MGPFPKGRKGGLLQSGLWPDSSLGEGALERTLLGCFLVFTLGEIAFLGEGVWQKCRYGWEKGPLGIMDWEHGCDEAHELLKGMGRELRRGKVR